MQNWGRFGNEKDFVDWITKKMGIADLEKKIKNLETYTRKLKKSVLYVGTELEKALKEKEATPE